MEEGKSHILPVSMVGGVYEFYSLSYTPSNFKYEGYMIYIFLLLGVGYDVEM